MILAVSMALWAQTKKPANDFASTWATIRTTIKSRYFASQTRVGEVESRLTRYAQIAPKAKTREEFVTIVQKMINEFHDSHFAIVPNWEMDYYGMANIIGSNEKMPNFGAWIVDSKAGPMVKWVIPGSNAAQIGMREGDIIASVGGNTFTNILDLTKYVGRKTPIDYRRGMETLTAKVMPMLDDPAEAFKIGTEKSVKTFDRNGKSFGYVKPTILWGEDEIAAVQGAFEAHLSDCDGIVFDLRDGFGGRPEQFADPLFRPGVTIKTKMGGQESVSHFGYSKPVVVLINHNTRSAREVLAYILQKSKRATLVGEKTAGAVLGTIPVRASSWCILEVPMAEMFVDDKRLEGIGVEPDIKATKPYSSDGKDAILEAGLAALAKQTGG